MLRSSLSGCWCDPERFLFEGIEDLLGTHPSDAVFLSEGLNGVAAKRIGAGFEEELEELAEKNVESLVLWRERDEVRPATSKEFSDLRAEGHVVFDELVAGAQQPAHSEDLRRWEMQALKAVPVGSERIGENEGVAPIILGAAHRMPVAETVDLLGIDGENGDGVVKKELDDSPMRFFDGHCDAFLVLRGQFQKPVDGF